MAAIAVAMYDGSLHDVDCCVENVGRGEGGWGEERDEIRGFIILRSKSCI